MKYLLLIAMLTLNNCASAVQINNAPSTAHLVQTDTTKTTSTKTVDISDDFSPGLLFFALIAICIMLICVGTGIAVGVTVLLIIAALVGTGIISASILVGLNRRSTAQGFKVFLVLSGSIAGAVGCYAVLLVLNHFMHLYLKQWMVLLYGAGGGLVTSFITGLILFIVIKRLLEIVKQRLNIQ